ncbi:hypothetical protein [Tenacibaculum sp. C7A-26P2]|uniref:hypothetical protein n=1 Tax=Tenacibaculum sp. C7A-26P2 TaxID=3447504 RepID=UPI003F869384
MTSIYQVNAQKQFTNEQEEENGFRIIGIIGHTLVNNKGLNNVMVPSWGLDVEYWFNEQWGIGFHNDIEIETFIIKNSKNEVVERVNPLVFTLDMLYHFGNGFVLTLGPGVEIEKEESYYLGRIGIEYEKDINKSFYVLPNIFLDQRFDGYNTWNVGLGIGVRL